MTSNAISYDRPVKAKMDRDAPKEVRGDVLTAPSVFRSGYFAFFYTFTATLTAVGAIYALSGSEGQAQKAVPVLQMNLLLVLGLGVYLLLSLRRIFTRSETGGSAPHLHRRFVLIFSLAALVPAILVGMFFTALMSRNLNLIFGPNISETMELSGDLSDAYLLDNRESIKQGVLNIAFDLNEKESHFTNRITYKAYLIKQAQFREFPAIFITNGDGLILARAESLNSPGYIVPRPEDFEAARSGAVISIPLTGVDFLGALYQLENYQDVFLYTGRNLRTGLLKNMENIEKIDQSVIAYASNSSAMNVVFLLTYIEVALLIFFAAIWLALMLANRIVSPLGIMVSAAEKVRSGDLTARVAMPNMWDEISDLASAFNRMTKQLGTQRDDLVLEHSISEERREFSEAVLSGVSAGVIGLSPEGKITAINSSAEKLLGLREKNALNQPLGSVIKGFMPAFNDAKDHLHNQSEDQINLDTPNGTKNLDIRVSSYKGEHRDTGGRDTGWVITFDDMTRLVAAQRHSAWREVARRIAHEIKNPLTPILLSAERLERKYGGEILSDPKTFNNCTQTIIRQVSNLGNMVDEFSAFARMPAPILEAVNIEKLIEEALFAQHVAFPEIEFVYDNKGYSGIEIFCDERLIGQALTNLYKNAGESIMRRMDTGGQGSIAGRIKTILSFHNDMIQIDIYDNGQGWPVDDYDRLLEPYMTTRKEGSGLGLAIVKRILEDHGGDLNLIAPIKPNDGAHVRLVLPRVDGANSPQIPSAHRVAESK